MKIIAGLFVFAGVVLAISLLVLWWVLPRKRVTKKPDGSTFVSRTGKGFQWHENIDGDEGA